MIIMINGQEERGELVDSYGLGGGDGFTGTYLSPKPSSCEIKCAWLSTCRSDCKEEVFMGISHSRADEAGRGEFRV